MAYKKKTPEERKAQIDKAFRDIESNIPTALDNDTFKDYLQTISKFHNYSINNQILMLPLLQDLTLGEITLKEA